MMKLGLRAWSLGALAAVAGTAAAGPVTLTGMNWYTLNAAKVYTGGYANTFGGDTYSRNLYVTENSTPGSGQLLNSLNVAALPTRISVDISSPGTYTFQAYCNGDSSSVT